MNEEEGLPIGTQIMCPRKHHLIGVLNEALMPGMTLKTSTVDFEPGQERIAGDQCKCAICDSWYLVQGKIYTADGWSPSDPTLEPVP